MQLFFMNCINIRILQSIWSIEVSKINIWHKRYGLNSSVIIEPTLTILYTPLQLRLIADIVYSVLNSIWVSLLKTCFKPWKYANSWLRRYWIWEIIWERSRLGQHSSPHSSSWTTCILFSTTSAVTTG